jgi:hypothetical protein
MKFSAGALAVIASKTGGDRSYDGRLLTTNANQLHHQHHATTHHEQGHERSEAPLASNALKNRKAHSKVTSTIIGKLQDLHEVVECDPMVEFDEDRQHTSVPTSRKLQCRVFSLPMCVTTFRPGPQNHVDAPIPILSPKVLPLFRFKMLFLRPSLRL